MERQEIDRINELARKSRTCGLTEAEKAEQKALREAYVAAVRRNFEAQLKDIRVLEPDGRVTGLKPKRRKAR